MIEISKKRVAILLLFAVGAYLIFRKKNKSVEGIKTTLTEQKIKALRKNQEDIAEQLIALPKTELWQGKRNELLKKLRAIDSKIQWLNKNG